MDKTLRDLTTSEASDMHSNVGAATGTEDPEVAGRRYRFDHLSLGTVLKDMYFTQRDPGRGDSVPDFDLATLAGGRFRSADLTENGPALLVFGSYTCPVTDNAAPGLNALHGRFGNRVRFVMVSVREAHPGKDAPQPMSLDEKAAHAEQLRDLHGFDFDVAVDDIDGTFHRAMSPKPNSAYLLGQDGTILFRAPWANDTKALATALEAVEAGKLPGRSQSGGVALPMLRFARDVAPALDRAGSGAWADMWRVAPPLAPPLAATAFMLKAFRIRPRKPAGTLRMAEENGSAAEKEKRP